MKPSAVIKISFVVTERISVDNCQFLKSGTKKGIKKKKTILTQFLFFQNKIIISDNPHAAASPPSVTIIYSAFSTYGCFLKPS